MNKSIPILKNVASSIKAYKSICLLSSVSLSKVSFADGKKICFQKPNSSVYFNLKRINGRGGGWNVSNVCFHVRLTISSKLSGEFFLHVFNLFLTPLLLAHMELVRKELLRAERRNGKLRKHSMNKIWKHAKFSKCFTEDAKLFFPFTHIAIAL